MGPSNRPPFCKMAANAPVLMSGNDAPRAIRA
jgi:hypothetical protein